jgi:hypothetical protein
MNPNVASKILSRLMTIVGLGLMLAFVFLVMPTKALSSIHEWLGLGVFPDQEIAVYLARSTSLLYGVHGVVMFVIGRNLAKYIALAWMIGWLHIAIGLVMLLIDLSAGMPWWWTAFEGLPVALTGLVIVLLSAKAASRQEVRDRG